MKIQPRASNAVELECMDGHVLDIHEPSLGLRRLLYIRPQDYENYKIVITRIKGIGIYLGLKKRKRKKEKEHA